MAVRESKKCEESRHDKWIQIREVWNWGSRWAWVKIVIPTDHQNYLCLVFFIFDEQFIFSGNHFDPYISENSGKVIDMIQNTFKSLI